MEELPIQICKVCGRPVMRRNEVYCKEHELEPGSPSEESYDDYIGNVFFGTREEGPGISPGKMLENFIKSKCYKKEK